MAVGYFHWLAPRPSRLGNPYLSRKQWAADSTQQGLISTPPHRNLSPGDLLFLAKMAACQGCEVMSVKSPPLIRN